METHLLKKKYFFFVCFLVKCPEVTTVAGSSDSEVSWDIKPADGGDSVCSSSVGCCFTMSGEYTITCSDSYGDGWNGYQVKFDGVEKCAGFTSGSTKIDTLTVNVSGIKYTFFQKCPNNIDLFPFWSSGLKINVG
jgi:hypothetical protein